MSLVCAIAMSGVLGQVVLRGSGDAERAEVQEVSLVGVRVGGDEQRTIGLDGVKLVVGDHAEDWALVSDMAGKAWRARVRLARGDYALAAPLFEELYAVYEGLEGPTALLACDGATRCRLSTGDRDGAVEAWLGALTLRRKGYKLAGDPPLDPVIDEATGLVPELAPVWGRGDSTVGMDVLDPAAYEDPFVRVMAELYQRGARGLSADGVDMSALEDERSRDTAAFVAVIIDALSEDSAARESGRTRLEAGLGNQVGTWREAWVRMALGRSYLLETSSSAQTNGVLHMLHVPARFGRTQWYLAGVAVSDAGIAFGGWGDDEVAGVLLGEMRSRYRSHPSLGALEAAVEGGKIDEVSDEATSECGAG